MVDLSAVAGVVRKIFNEFEIVVWNIPPYGVS